MPAARSRFLPQSQLVLVAGGGGGTGLIVWGEEEEMMLGMGQDQIDLSQYYAQFGATDVIPGSDILRMSLDNEGYLTNAAGTVVGRLDDSGNLVPAATYSVTGTDKAPATPITQVPPAATPCKQTIFKDIKGFCDTYLWIGLATLGGMLLMKGRR